MSSVLCAYQRDQRSAQEYQYDVLIVALETIVEIFNNNASVNAVSNREADISNREADLDHSTTTIEKCNIVECPLCSKYIDFAIINQHMDSGCKLQSRPKAPQRKAKALVPYDLLKDSKIRSLLQDDKLPTRGTRSALIKRHHEWILLYNSNLDAKNPLSDSELRKTIISNEANCSTAPSLKTPRGHDIDPAVEEAVSLHVEKYQADFDQMIESIRKRPRSKASSDPNL
jgi:hypothetical protein